MTVSLADLMSRPAREMEFTLECSGNTGLPFFTGGVGNAVWGGAQLAPLLKRARPLESAARSCSGAPTRAPSRSATTRAS